MYLDFILLLFALYIHIFPLLQGFQIIPYKKGKDPRKLWLVMHILSIILIIITAIINDYNFIELSPVILFFPGFNILFLIIGLIKNPDAYSIKNLKFLSLKKEDYKYITQDTIPVGGTGLTLPIGQDFSYVNNYLYLPATNEYILFTSNALTQPHDINITIRTQPDIGKNVYVCTDLKITDNTTLLDKYLLFVKIALLISIVIGVIPASFVLTHVTPAGAETIFPDWILIIGPPLFYTIIGSVLILVSYLTESKIIKIFWIIFGSILLFGGLFYMFL